MRVKLYVDVKLGDEKKDLYFSQKPNFHKMRDAHRYEIIVNLPEIDDEVDMALNAFSVKDISDDK